MPQVDLVSQFKIRYKPNSSRMKSLFIRTKQGMTMRDIITIAKHEAGLIGMGSVEVYDVLRSNNCDGYVVIVQSVWST